MTTIRSTHRGRTLGAAGLLAAATEVVFSAASLLSQYLGTDHQFGGVGKSENKKLLVVAILLLLSWASFYWIETRRTTNEPIAGGIKNRSLAIYFVPTLAATWLVQISIVALVS